MMLGVATAKVSLDASDFISNAAKVASASGQMEQAVSKSGGSLGDKILANAGNLTKFGLIMGGIGAGITGAFALGEKTAIGFGREMANVNSIAQLSQKQLDAVGRSVQDIAIATGKGPTDLAAGLYDVYSVGFQGADAMKILEISAKGANAGLTDTSTSARVLTGTLNAFGVSGDQAQHYMDVLFQTVNDGAVSFEELSHNLANTAPMASTLGVSIEELGAGYALMTKNGIPAAQTETQIAALMRAGVNPTGDMTKALNDYGYTSVSSLIKAKGFGGYLEFLNKASGGTAEGMSKLLGSSEAVNAALVLGKNGLKGYNEELTSMKGASEGAGATQRALDKQMESTSFKLQRLGAAFDVLKIRMVSGFTAPLNFGIDAITKLIQALANLPPGVQKVIATIAGLTGVLLTVGGASILAAVKIAEFGKLVRDLTGAESAIGGIASMFGKVGTAAKSAAASMRLITIEEGAISAGPLLPWLIAIAAAAGLFYLAYKTNFLGVRDATNKAIDTFKSLGNYIRSVWKDGDYLNDWLTHLPKAMQGPVEATGKFIAGFHTLTSEFGRLYGAWRKQGYGPISASFMALGDGLREVFGGTAVIDQLNGVAKKVSGIFDAGGGSAMMAFARGASRILGGKSFSDSIFGSGGAGGMGNRLFGAAQRTFGVQGKNSAAAFADGFIQQAASQMGIRLPNMIGLEVANAFTQIGSTINKLGDYFNLVSRTGTHFNDILNQLPAAVRPFAASLGIAIASVQRLGAAFASGGIIGVAKEFPNFLVNMSNAFQAFEHGISLNLQRLATAFPALAPIFRPLANAFDQAGLAAQHFALALKAALHGNWNEMLTQMGLGAHNLVKDLASLGEAGRQIAARAFPLIGDAANKIFQLAGNAFDGLAHRFKGLAPIFSPFADALRNTGRAVQLFGSALGKAFKGDFTGAFKDLLKGTGNVGKALVNLTRTGLGVVSSLAAGLQKGIGGAVDSLTQKFPAFAGLWQRLGGVGQGVLGVVKNLAQGFSDLLHGDFGGFFKNMGQAAVDGLKAVGNAMGTVPSLIAGAFKAINWSGVGSALMSGLDTATNLAFQGLSIAGGAIAKGWNGLTTALSNFSWSGLGDTLLNGLQSASTMAFSALNAAGGAIGGALGGAWDWIKNTASNIDWGSIANTITGGAAGVVAGLAGSISGAAGDIWGWIKDKVSNIDWTTIGSTLFLAGHDAAVSIKNGIVDGANAVWDWLKGLGGELKGHITGAADWLKSTGSDIINGLWNGMKSVWSSVESWFETALNQLIVFVNKAIGMINKLSSITGVHIDPIPLFGELGKLQTGMDAAVKHAKALKQQQQELAKAFTAAGDAATKAMDAFSGNLHRNDPINQQNRPPAGVTPVEPPTSGTKISPEQGKGIDTSVLPALQRIGAQLSLNAGGAALYSRQMANVAAVHASATPLVDGFNLAANVEGAAMVALTQANMAAEAAQGKFSGTVLSTLPPVQSLGPALQNMSVLASDSFMGIGISAATGLAPIAPLIASTATTAIGVAAPAFAGILGAATASFGGLPPVTEGNFGAMLGSVSANSAAANAVASAETAGMAANVGANASNMASSAISSALNMQSGVEGAVIGAASTVAIQTAIAAATAEANASRMGSAGREGGLSYASGIQSGMGLAIASAAAGAAGVASALGPQDLSGAGFSTGASFSSGIASGILSNLGAIQAAASQVVSAAAAASAATAMIHSPSRLFARDIGEPITLGTAMGMTSKRSMLAIQSAGRSVINATRGIMAPVVSPRMAVAGRASGGSVVVNNNQQLHIQQNPGEDMNAFATRVIDILTESGRSIA